MKHFCGLGPGKAGTTWLYDYFRCHSQVANSSIKETYFFSRNFDKGNEWYESLYKFKKESSCFGDISNQYFLDKDVVSNVLKFYPETIFFLFLRNPKDRLRSCFTFEVKQGFTGTLREYVRDTNLLAFDNQALLNRYRAEIPVGQLFVINFQDIIDKPSFVIENICNLLEINVKPIPKNINKNVSVKPRIPFITRVLRRFAFFLRNIGCLDLLQKLKNNKILRCIIYTNDRVTVEKEDMEFVGKIIPRAYHVNHSSRLY